MEVELTEEEREAVNRTLGRFAAVAKAQAPEGMYAAVSLKMRNGMIAQGLTEYVEDVMGQLRHCESNTEVPSLMNKGIKAMMKAFAIHNLPVYLFQIAGMFELVGDSVNAKKFYRDFLQQQRTFKPDGTDATFQNAFVSSFYPEFDASKIVAIAIEKAR